MSFVLRIIIFTFSMVDVKSMFIDNEIYSHERRVTRPRSLKQSTYIIELQREETTPLKFVSLLRQTFPHRSLRYSSDPPSENIEAEIHVVELRHVFHGVVVAGLHKHELSLFPHIVRIIPDSVRYLTTYDSTPWGIDRIDQQSLPLDGKYNSIYTGAGIDAYVVDTGIDTSHSEFQSPPGSTRIVKNIYDAFISNKRKPEADTDDVGHGTHCAGTIGGISVGVSPYANIYGLKILNSDGEGSSSDILEALEYIASLVKKSKRLSVVSLSLGGPCDDDNCATDSLIGAVEALSMLGVPVSVAAGNEGCNACRGSPNSAPHAISVAASNIKDSIAYFSNYGQCIDIIAPGYDIVSACCKFKCGDEISYVKFSGTSMACPHVAGAIAQILQKLKLSGDPYLNVTTTNTVSYVLHELSCRSSKNQIILDHRDTITKNFLVRIPSTDAMTNFITKSNSTLCHYNSGCQNDCSDAGYCLTSRSNSQELISSQCFCESFHYGATCSASLDQNCLTAGHAKVYISMIDTYGDGWSLTSYVITDSEGQIVDNAYDSLCYGDSGTNSYCLPPGNYTFTVNRGPFPQEIGWKMCGVSGGAPYSIELLIHNGHCTPVCPANTKMTQLILRSDDEDVGWDGAYYAIYSLSTGKQLYGGTLPSGKEQFSQVCLPQSQCSVMFLQMKGFSLADVSFSICGYDGSGNSWVQICIDSNDVCTASPYGLSNSTANSVQCANMDVSFELFDTTLKGSTSVEIIITNATAGSTSASVVLFDINASGFNTFRQSCLPDGCYLVEFQPRNHSLITTEAPSSYPSSIFWHACGYLGNFPASTIMCLEQKYNLCYGLDGCLYIKSYAHYSDYQNYFITEYEPTKGIDVITENGNLHGVNSLCSLGDGCYEIYGGGGKYYSVIHDRNKIFLCNDEIGLPLQGKFCIGNNRTTCSFVPSSQNVCPAGNIPTIFMKFDIGGDGWGSRSNYVITYASSTSPGGSGSGGGNRGRATHFPASNPEHDDVYSGGGNGGGGYGTDDIFSIGDDARDPSYGYGSGPSYGNGGGVADGDGLSYGYGSGGGEPNYGYVPSHHAGSHISKNIIASTDRTATVDGTISAVPISTRVQNVLNKQKSDFYVESHVLVTERKNLLRSHFNHHMRHQTQGNIGDVAYTGTLSSGQIGADNLCLQIGQCYSITINSRPVGADEILWKVCGYMGDYITQDMRFCVTSAGCEFEDVSYPDYYNSMDDDFPLSVQDPVPSSLPSLTLTPSIEPTLQAPIQVTSTPIAPPKSTKQPHGHAHSSAVPTIFIDASNSTASSSGFSGFFELGSTAKSAVILLFVLIPIVAMLFLIFLCAINHKNIRGACVRRMALLRQRSDAYDQLGVVDANEIGTEMITTTNSTPANNATVNHLAMNTTPALANSLMPTGVTTTSYSATSVLSNSKAAAIPIGTNSKKNSPKKSNFDMKPILLSAAHPGGSFQIVQLEDTDDDNMSTVGHNESEKSKEDLDEKVSKF